MAFVGRRSELERLGARLAALASRREGGGGGGGLALISGEPGVGKSALARELAFRAAGHGVGVRRGACYEGEWQPPYQLWIDVLDGQRPLAATAPTLSADEEQRRLIDALARQLLALAGAEPTLVVLEDLQWADADSLALLRRAARAASGAPLLIVGTHRSGDTESAALDDFLAHVTRETDVLRVALSGFDGEEVAQYAALTTGDALPGALVKLIHDETRGNPFFVREVLNHLIEEQKIARQMGRWTTETSIAELGIPDGVRRVVRRRVARLSRATQDVLTAAATFTAGIDPAVLALVVERSETDTLDCLDEAVEAQLLRPTGERRAGFDFAHAIVRHALYDELNGARRRELHARVAAVLEAAPASVRRSAELAAQHYRAGAAAGVPHCIAAADHARAAHANDQAARFVRMAVELQGEEADPVLVGRLAISEAEALALDTAAETAARALDALVAAGRPDQAIALVASVARLLKESGAPASAWSPLVERGLLLVGDRRDLAWARLRLLVSPMAPLSEGGLHVGRWTGHDPRAVALAVAEGTQEDAARTVEAWDWRDRAETLALVEEARTWRSPAAILRAYEAANRSLLFRHGDLYGAEQLMQHLLELAVDWGSVAAQGEALTQLSLCHAFLGRNEQAQDELAHARAIVEPLGAAHRQHLAVNVSHAILVAYVGPHDVHAADWAVWGERAVRLVEQPFLSRSAPLGLICGSLGAMAYGVAGDAAHVKAVAAPLTTLLERSDTRDYGATGALWMTVAACWHAGYEELAERHAALIDRFEAAGLGAGPFTSWSLARARLAGRSRPELFTAAADELAAAGHLALAARATAEGAPAPAPLKGAPLTSREAQILGLIAGGYTNQEIAEELHLSVATVNRHVANIYLKIGARNRASATAYALRLQAGAAT